jgi:aspartyl-tRNA(Asn)/glutamyl-tRNA(Gln) amidotransferase subunit B
MSDGSAREIGITRLHLEQDAGKSLHDQHPSLTYVDLNRAGVGLMEIVSEPDLRSAEEAGAYLRKLRAILRYLGTCDGNMEEGSLRCDANVSVRRPGDPYGTRCEIKNLNSVRYVMQAIEYEARRQVELLEEGGKVAQQTRLFDVGHGVTRPMRSKEEAHDYRYFPDPDLLPLVLDPAWVEGLRAGLPELPDAKKARFVAALGLTPEDAAVLVAERDKALYFEEATLHAPDARAVAHWIINELSGLLERAKLTISDSPITAEQTGILVEQIINETITRQSAKSLYQEMFQFNHNNNSTLDSEGPPPFDLHQRLNEIRRVIDEGAIAAAIDAVLAAQPDKVAEYRGGRDKLYGFFVGQIMRATQGKANPALVNELLKKKLAS